MIKKKRFFVHSSSIISKGNCSILASKIALDVSYRISLNTRKKNKILFISFSLSFVFVIPRHIRCIILIGKIFDTEISIKVMLIN